MYILVFLALVDSCLDMPGLGGNWKDFINYSTLWNGLWLAFVLVDSVYFQDWCTMTFCVLVDSDQFVEL